MHQMEVIKMSMIVIIAPNILYILTQISMIFIFPPLIISIKVWATSITMEESLILAGAVSCTPLYPTQSEVIMTWIT